MSPQKAKLESIGPNQLEALTKADEHLRFTTKVIERSALSDSTRAELRRQIELIRKRYADPNLYLAVIGEFSSGKSTFINALLRDDLLKRSALVTTAAATSVRHGDSLRVEAKFKGSRQQTVKAQPKYTYDQIKEYVHEVTSEAEVAQSVTEITITHPAAFLADGTIIIDTPGTNAPDAETINREHGEIVRRVLENDADAAIVIISADRPGPKTLIEFLDSAVKPFLHRCLFVITKMAYIDPEEQSTLLDYVSANLARQLHIEPPVVYPCSAQVVLDHNTQDKVSQVTLDWTKRFVELEYRVTERLRHERALSIAENIVRLLNRLMEQLESDLQALEESHKARRAAVERETIRDLSSFAAEHREESHKMFEAAISSKRIRENVSKIVRRHRQNTTGKIRTTISTAESTQALDNFIKNEAEALLERDQRLLYSNLESEFGKLRIEVSVIALHFDTVFATEYRRLRSLGGQFEKNPTSISNSEQTSTSNVVSSMQSVREALNVREGSSILGGAAAGAALGTIYMPVAGTLLGAGIGTLLGAFLGGVSLDKRKQRYWERLAPALDDYFDEVEKRARAELNTYKAKSKSALTRHINYHVTKYKSIVDAMIREQQIEKQQLQRLQKATRADLANIRRRRKTLNEQRDHLTAMTRLDNDPVGQNAEAYTVARTVDDSGNILETILNDSDEIIGEYLVGNVADLLVEDEYIDDEGRVVSRVKDDSGNAFEVISDDQGNVVRARAISRREE